MNILTLTDPKYPARLQALHKPPQRLYISGDTKLWESLKDRPAVAIVGSRKTTDYGRETTKYFVNALGARGVIIVSGLALGIDSIAHQAALDAGTPTIAVLPAGFKNIYPRSHMGLARRIVDSGGVLVSEYPPDEKIAYKGNFVARNRIIAGLADVLLIPEAVKKSGSLHTANFALNIGRDIFAVPGPINSPSSEGCNNLIKTGAYMADDVNDILDKLGIVATSPHELPLVDDAIQTKIIQFLADGPQSADAICTELSVDIQTFNQSLSMLEINGHIKPLGNNTWSL